MIRNIGEMLSEYPRYSQVVVTIEMIIVILLGVAYITLSERKIMGYKQRRRGPNKVGLRGLLQPLVDGGKLMIKEIIIPSKSKKLTYIIGVTITLILSIIIYIPIPIGNIEGVVSENKYSIIYILAISSISGYIGIIIGNSSNSKYTIIGGIRIIAQVISYEVSLGIIIMSVIIGTNTLNLLEIEYNQIYIETIYSQIIMGGIMIISIIVETNRPPFDLSEAESELVAGILTEYGGMGFAGLYLAEYGFIMSMSMLASILYLGTINYTIVIIYIFIWVRVALPRIRYDELLRMGWTKILPLSIGNLVLTLSTNVLLN